MSVWLHKGDEQLFPYSKIICPAQVFFKMKHYTESFVFKGSQFQGFYIPTDFCLLQHRTVHNHTSVIVQLNIFHLQTMNRLSSLP